MMNDKEIKADPSFTRDVNDVSEAASILYLLSVQQLHEIIEGLIADEQEKG